MTLKMPVKALAVRHAARKHDPARAHLDTVYRDADGSYISTDGHMLLHAQVADSAPGEAAIVERETVEAELKVAKARKAETVEVADPEWVKPEQFPQWRTAMGTPGEGDYASGVTVEIDGRLLERVIKAAAEFRGRKGRDPINLRFHFAKKRAYVKPIIIEAYSDTDPDKLTALVMPIVP